MFKLVQGSLSLKYMFALVWQKELNKKKERQDIFSYEGQLALYQLFLPSCCSDDEIYERARDTAPSKYLLKSVVSNTRIYMCGLSEDKIHYRNNSRRNLLLCNVKLTKTALL